MKVENTIYIAASPDVVWAVTKDVDRWPEWTPTVTSVGRANADKPFGLGSVVRIKQPAQPASDWTVTEFEPGHRFAWMTRRLGLRMTGTHELSAAGGGTENVLSVMAEGIVALLLWPLLRPAMRRALSVENRGLKNRCEEIARARSRA